MNTKSLRQARNLSQEQLADITGLSLRTVQRAESGEGVSNSSLRPLAEFFEISIEDLKQEGNEMTNSYMNKSNRWTFGLSYHRAMQLMIFIITFFVCVVSWSGYYAQINPGTSNASLWTILNYVAMIAIGAAIFAYIFNHARVIFCWSYYLEVAGFVVLAFFVNYWTQAYADSSTYQLVFPVFFLTMLLALSIIHILQMALSLKAESTVYKLSSEEGDSQSPEAGLGRA